MADPTPDSIPTVPARAARSARFWRLVAHTLVLLAVFVAGLVVAVILHANTRPGRAIVTSALNAILTDTFYGSVRVESVAAISLQTVHASRVSVFDEAGERVLTLNDIRLELDAVDNLLRYVHAGQSWTLEFPHARVEQARVLLVTDATSQAPTLSRALTPRPRPPRLPRWPRRARCRAAFLESPADSGRRGGARPSRRGRRGRWWPRSARSPLRRRPSA